MIRVRSGACCKSGVMSKFRGQKMFDSLLPHDRAIERWGSADARGNECDWEATPAAILERRSYLTGFER